mgnify:CR=1 FL=1
MVYLLYFELLCRFGAIELNPVAYATPVFAAPSGGFVLGKHVHVQPFAGFTNIVNLPAFAFEIPGYTSSLCAVYTARCLDFGCPHLAVQQHEWEYPVGDALPRRGQRGTE